MDSDPAGPGDRLSSLEDSVLGHILSFLPAAEAARAAVLSRRWRHVFAAVHTLSFDEPERGDRDRYGYADEDTYSVWSSDYSASGWGCGDPVGRRYDLAAPPFVTGVTAALLGRHRGRHVPAAPPIRALRVALAEFREGASAQLVNVWLSYAVHQAAGELHIDLRLGRRPICLREYALRRRRHAVEVNAGDKEDSTMYEHEDEPDRDAAGDEEEDPDDGDDMGEDGYSSSSPYLGPGDARHVVYVAPRSLFSCAVLRTLRLGPCRLDPPAAVDLPSLHTLHLTSITGVNSPVQRLVAGCPRLADLTLEACATVTTLSLLDARLRRLALRCCHGLASIAVDSSELREFEYRGAAPAPAFLTMHGPCVVSSCTLDFCGEEPGGEPSEPARLACFLRPLAGTETLHLKSAHLLAGIYTEALPVMAALRSLELTGMLPEDDATAAVVTAVTTVLERTPSLETLSLFFLPGPEDPVRDHGYYYHDTLHAAHHLRYNRYTEVTVPEGGTTIPCLRETTREINLVHYQGGMAQRTLAKFLLRNAAVTGEVFCGFALGPLWMQTGLMEEIRGWAMNKSANMMFF
ncbi:hypothetical protein ACP4OV_002048 [Aristida adscensionis]